MKLGIIREGKIPLDRRVPLIPKQCQFLLERYADLKILVQPSAHRIFSDEEYQMAGVTVAEDLSACDVLFGVKEVPVEMLIPHKTYLFFSHTYKKQVYNRRLLQQILEKKIRLIDYEMLKDHHGTRLLGFGRYAGIVGAYNAFRAWGEMKGGYKLKPAHECIDRNELEAELNKVQLAEDMRIVVTGDGRVASGVLEIFSALRLSHRSPEEFLKETFEKPIFTQLDLPHYFEREDGRDFERQEFYANAAGFRSAFMKYAACANMYIAAHLWSDKSPYIFTHENARAPDFKIELISDISCDIDGPVASTLRPSTIEDPFYGYDPITENEVPFGTPNSIGVSAVDNLPCELPRDASEDFGNELIKNVIPHFFNKDEVGILERASETTLTGELGRNFTYLQDYVKG